MQNQPITGIDSAQPTSCTQITIKGTQEKKRTGGPTINGSQVQGALILSTSGGIVQWVERLTKTPGAVRTGVQFHVLGRDFSSGSTFSADSLTAFVQPSSVCNRMRQEMHVHTLKIPNTGSHAVAWTHENAAHADRNS